MDKGGPRTSSKTRIDVGGDHRQIAALVDEGRAPTIVWLGGFRSDMTGSKAEALAAFGRARGNRVVRFDYSGHGVSGGAFEDGTISRWSEEAGAIIDALAPGPVVLVGSSMGGWIALLQALRLAQAHTPRLIGLVLIAPAPDFTERLMYAGFPPDMRESLERDGRVAIPSAYSDEPTVVTRQLIEDGRRHLLLDGPIRIGAPIRILQGMRDEDVPHGHALALTDRLADDDVVLTLIKDGDHRLSRQGDIERILAAVERILE
jgi:pimeloyl-ACP methyl ester carboxylesterase